MFISLSTKTLLNEVKNEVITPKSKNNRISEEADARVELSFEIHKDDGW